MEESTNEGVCHPCVEAAVYTQDIGHTDSTQGSLCIAPTHKINAIALLSHLNRILLPTESRRVAQGRAPIGQGFVGGRARRVSVLGGMRWKGREYHQLCMLWYLEYQPEIVRNKSMVNVTNVVR